MAILNGMYIHVVEETVTGDVKTTSHPVETGIPMTDTVKAEALIISLSGKIVDYGDMTSAQVQAKIKSLRDTGSLVEYKGRNVASSMQIQSLETSHPNTNHGGADFTMVLKKVRIAKSAYTPKKPSTTQQQETTKTDPDAVKATIKVGSTVVFKGGSVYVSSDAKKAAATRSRSTCKVQKISTASYSVHQYCLKSTDGKMVNGWVDLANIEGAEATGTNGKTNAGTQQVTSGSGTKKAVYHTVKRGDTVWALVNKSYKNLNTTVSWVINNNPKAFSKKGDATTLKVGAKLLMGYK